MKDEELLRALADLAREQRDAEPADPRLDALADDRLSPDEEAALRDELPPEVVDLFRPVSAEIVGLAGDRALAQLAPFARTVVESTPPIKARRPFRMLLLAAPLVAAAAVAIFILRPNAGPPMPTYALSASGGEQGVRGPASARPDDPPLFGAGSRLTLVAQPDRSDGAKVEAKLFVSGPGGPRQWPAKLEVSAEGAVRLSATFEELEFSELPVGEWEVLLVVGRPGALPDDPKTVELAATRPGAPDARWRVLRQPIRLR